MIDPIPPDPKRPFDAVGAILSAVGMFCIVFGILQAGKNRTLLIVFIGLGLGVMLTPSVNIVQSAFPEDKQGEISGLSRSISNLGSSFGTAIVGTILVSDLAAGNGGYVPAMIVLAALGLVGLGIAFQLPTNPLPSADADVSSQAAPAGALGSAA